MGELTHHPSDSLAFATVDLLDTQIRLLSVLFSIHGDECMRSSIWMAASFLAFGFSQLQAAVFFSTGDADGRMGMVSRVGSSGAPEIEAADDFILQESHLIDQVTFNGLIPTGATIEEVRVEIYRVFPKDSADPPSGNVPTRVNSPSDVAFQERDGTSGLSFTSTDLGSFTVANSVVNGINPIPGQTTGGEGPVSGNEVLLSVMLGTPLVLPPDHYFFIPQVRLSNGDFLWLSAAKPIVSPGTPFTPDLQTWIRNEALDPDWLRVGTDIVGGTPAPTFNGVFSLSGVVVPEPMSLSILGASAIALLICRTRKSDSDDLSERTSV